MTSQRPQKNVRNPLGFTTEVTSSGNEETGTETDFDNSAIFGGVGSGRTTGSAYAILLLILHDRSKIIANGGA